MKIRPEPLLLMSVVAALAVLATVGCTGTPNGPQPTPTPTPPEALPVLLEVDQMQGTPPLQNRQTLGGVTVSLEGIYAPGGIDMEVRHDQDDLPTVPSVRLADLHALLTTFRSVPAPAGGRHVHVLVVTADADDPDTLGIMFDFGDNDPNDIPREGCAVFASAHEGLSGGVAPELLLTTAHEVAHVFNLHHTDWEGDGFQGGATIESYSMADTVRWALSTQSRNHLLSHPRTLVNPGPGSLPFASITAQHAAGHRSTPAESYVVIDEANLPTARRAPGGVREMAVRSAREGRVLARDAHPLRLELTAPKGEYLVGEPLILTAGVRNAGPEAREVLELLDPAFGFLNVEIRRPGSRVFEPFRPAVRAYKRGGHPVSLAPGETLHAEVKLFFGAEGWTFEEPGDYVIRADYPADSLAGDERLQSGELPLKVVPPTDDTARRASRLMLGTEPGLYLLFEGGDHLRQGRENLQKVSQEAGSTPFAPAAQLALGRAALEPTVGAAGVTTRPPARLEEAQRYLAGTLDSDLPALSRLQAQEALADALVRDDKVSEAQAVRQRALEALEDDETATQEIQRFRRKRIE